MEEKYLRQIIMPEIGEKGQKKLKNAKILVIGAGGLGCPALLYLNAAGIGTLGIADADTVSEVNLHRQILHSPADVHKNKAESASETLKILNPDTEIKIYPFYIDAENITEIIREYDFIIDAVDNFETKFLINDACVIEKKPFCHAGVIRFNAQAISYVPEQGPCMRCVFEDVPDYKKVPSCVQAGVLGPVCGIMGCIQATEAIKYITGAGKLLTGAMYCIDALTMKSRIVHFPNGSYICRVCSKSADIKDVRQNAGNYIR